MPAAQVPEVLIAEAPAGLMDERAARLLRLDPALLERLPERLLCGCRPGWRVSPGIV